MRYEWTTAYEREMKEGTKLLCIVCTTELDLLIVKLLCFSYAGVEWDMPISLLPAKTAGLKELLTIYTIVR